MEAPLEFLSAAARQGVRRIAIAAIAAITAAVAACSSSPPSERRDDSTPPGASVDAPSIAPGTAEVRTVEEAASAAADHARAATVCLVFQGRARNVRGTGSGVIVGQEGDRAWILTCGHVARVEGRRCRVILSDGRLLDGEVKASVLQGGIDLGLVECDTGGEVLPSLPLATDAPRRGDWVMVLGHPRGLWIEDRQMAGPEEGSEPSDEDRSSAPRWDTATALLGVEDGARSIESTPRPPIVRAGRIWEEPGAGSGIRFDAPIDSGDSGGPVIDLEGRVVGIASRCGWKSHWNWASSVLALNGDARNMLDGSITWPEHSAEPGAGSGDPRPPMDSRNHRSFLDTLRSTASMAVGRSVAVVESEGGPRAFAIAVDRGGAFVTMGSEAGFREPIELVAGGRRIPAQRLAYDSDADLLLLRAGGLDAPPLPIAREDAPLRAGSVLLTVGADGEVIAAGSCSLEPFRAEEVDARPFLGVSSRPRAGGGATIRAVSAGTPAARAGLEIGDTVLAVDGVEVTARRTLSTLIAEHRVGDRVRLDLDRDGDRRTVQLVVGRRPPSMRSRDPGNTRIAITSALPYRTVVLQHDGAIEPHECGSPVIDLAGRAVGVNVARFDRTSTWAMPIDEFGRRVRNLLLSPPLDSSRFAAFEDAGFVGTEQDGRIRLAADDARTVGARDLRRAFGELRAMDGSGITVHSDDRLHWEIEIERPGRFEVLYHGSAAGEQIARIWIDGVAHDATLGEGEYAEGATLGEVEIGAVGRHRVGFEWSAVQHHQPGNMARLELRRIERPRDERETDS